MHLNYARGAFRSYLLFFLLVATYVHSTGQSHTFASFNVGTITSNTPGVSTTLNTAPLTGNYLVFSITADFVGTGNVAYSSTIHAEISDGGSNIYKMDSRATDGWANDGNPTTLSWTGLLNVEYVGGTPLVLRIFDDFHDAMGPYTSNITNVVVTIYEANINHCFPAFSPGALSSNTAGVSTVMNTAALTSDYLLYHIEADFIGTGNVAYSSTIHAELSDGGSTLYVADRRADNGWANDGNATTLTWTGVMNLKFNGGAPLTLRIFDDFHDAMGPYTSNITNVKLTIYNLSNDHCFATYSPGALTSGTSGISTSMNTAGVPAGGYMVYTIDADFVGTGNVAYSSTIEAELTDGSGETYLPMSRSTNGSANDGNATTLSWTGVLTQEYSGTDPLTLRFWDSFNDAMGPYTSNITNVKVTLYRDGGVSLPVELSNFDAIQISDDVVRLDWATQSENNSDRYEIERSSDGENFTLIGSLEAQGFSSTTSEYFLLDDSPNIGVNYYRLKMVDRDQSFTLSPLKQLYFNKSIRAYPNPSSGQFVVHDDENIHGSHEKWIRIYNSSGKIIRTIQMTNKKTIIDLTDSPAGIYSANLGEGKEFVRLVKK